LVQIGGARGGNYIFRGVFELDFRGLPFFSDDVLLQVIVVCLGGPVLGETHVPLSIRELQVELTAGVLQTQIPVQFHTHTVRKIIGYNV